MLSPPSASAILLFLHAYRFAIAVGFLIIILILIRMRVRRFYLVRHGESILNAQNIRQDEKGSLSEKGKKQADEAGLYLTQFPIQQIISSPYQRTRETALTINTHLNVRIKYSDLLVERRNPSEIVGKRDDDPAVKQIVDQIDRAYHDDTYKFSDEENFQELKDRAGRALAFLSRQTAQGTCVVTHSIFLKMLIAYLLYRENLHATDYIKLSFFNPSDNASVTICEFNPWKRFAKNRGWQVLEYNQHG
jgi:broad specificity phosphatase PhoE